METENTEEKIDAEDTGEHTDATTVLDRALVVEAEPPRAFYIH